MTLFINTSSNETMLALLAQGKILALKTFLAEMKESEKLLPEIDELLVSNGLTIHDLTKIMVVSGPGSFTGLRVGVTVANTLASTLSIPIVGITCAEILSYRLRETKNLNKISVLNALGRDNFWVQAGDLARVGSREGSVVGREGVGKLEGQLLVDLSSFPSELIGKNLITDLKSTEEALLALDAERAGEIKVIEPFYAVGAFLRADASERQANITKKDHPVI